MMSSVRTVAVLASALVVAPVSIGASPASALPRIGEDHRPCDGPSAAQAGEAPGDFELVLVEGGGPGGFGRSTLTIDATGVAVVRKGRLRPMPQGGPADPNAGETRRRLSRSAVNHIWARVVACRFFELDRSYVTRGIVDGWGMTVTVRAGGRSHSVNTHMYRVDRLHDIAETVRGAMGPGARR